ncbi:hypothetical protein N9L47_07015 [Rhodobacteraceae bacterium]|nr:hypothetical protein [Paracoccaceae bacterium]
MMKYWIVIAGLIAGPAFGQDKSFTLSAPDSMTANGFLKHLLPRFSLKSGIRISISEPSDASFGTKGVPVFQDGATVWHFSKTDGPYTDAFLDWLTSDVGKNTIAAFKVDDVAVYDPDVQQQKAVVENELTGDVVLGEKVSLSLCGRCHVVNDTNRMKAIGSSPSFALLRGFPDWQNRFEAFFVLKPHPAFTQVEDVTEPFPDHLPSPMSPIEVTLEQIEAITAYVGSIEPADLGAPLAAN